MQKGDVVAMRVPTLSLNGVATAVTFSLGMILFLLAFASTEWLGLDGGISVSLWRSCQKNFKTEEWICAPWDELPDFVRATQGFCVIGLLIYVVSAIVLVSYLVVPSLHETRSILIAICLLTFSAGCGPGCSSVDSVPTFEAIDRRIDPSQWTELWLGYFPFQTVVHNWFIKGRGCMTLMALVVMGIKGRDFCLDIRRDSIKLFQFFAQGVYASGHFYIGWSSIIAILSCLVTLSSFVFSMIEFMRINDLPVHHV